MSGAGATLVFTFAVVALFMRRTHAVDAYPRIVLLRGTPARAVLAARVLGVGLFALTVCAGLLGAQDAYRNLATTMVWIVGWVGIAFACALIGDLWALAGPLRTLFAWSEKAYAALTGGRPLSRNLAYPERLGAWPAVLLFFLFAWAELVWQDKDVPLYLARALLGYAVLTWAGMFLFGREVWLARGEAFALAFGTLARFAPLHAPDGRLELRPPGAGLLADRAVSPSYLAFVILMLSTVTFDGFLETPLMRQLEIGLRIGESQGLATALLGLFPLAFLAAFALASWAMVRCAGSAVPPGEAARAFVLTLVPIAVAYHLAHYFSLLLSAGQFIIPLASDPFGFGWDLLGTAGYKVDLALVSPYVFWYGAVAIIVLGHVIAVVLAHLTALRVFGARAVASQAPMLALMVAYTTLSLWILAQPIVA